jgi:hypothetical protein
VRGPTLPLPNITGTYASSPHGGGSGSAGLDPTMGYGAGDVLTCDVCHDSHGSPNPFLLKTSVKSKDGSKTKGGLFVVTIADPQNPAKNGYDLRFFCNACHDAGEMGNSSPLPSDCVDCHPHNSTN